MRTVISYYKFRGTSKLIMLIIDDSLANLIRANNLSLSYNVANITEARNKIAQVLGTEDMMNTAYPLAYKEGMNVGDFANDLPLFMPNAFIDSTPGSNLDCEVGDIDLYSTLFTNSTQSQGEVNKIVTTTYAGKTPYYLCGEGSFSGTSGNYYYMACSFFVFKESEYNDGNFVFTDTTTQMPTVCRIAYVRPYASATSQHRLEISVRASNTADLSARLIFNNFTPPRPPAPSNDPYDPSGDGSGYSGSGGGPAGAGGTGATGTGGLHDDTSDPIATPSTPTDVAISSGLITAYNPTASQLADLGHDLWTATATDFDDLFRILFGGDAFNAIIGLHLIPVQPSVEASPSTIKLGNWSSSASAKKITSQYVQVPFGSLTLAEFWGNAIDYAPYTRVQLALPYIGIVDVDTDDVIGSVNTLTYNIDVLSGALCATLHCVKGNLSSVIYEWSGSCAVQIPMTGASFNAIGSALMATVGASVATAATAMTGGSAALLAAGGLAMSGSAANIFGSQKGKVQKSGSFGANSGALGIMTPYFIITRPVQSVPSTQQATKGYPANISAHLGDLVGYTELIEVHLHDIPGTKDEVLEIEQLLKSGVIF